MEKKTQDRDIPRLTRDLVSALAGAITEHQSSVVVLRDAVCAYYDALVAEGRDKDDVKRAISSLLSGSESPRSGTTAKRRQRLFDDMIEWCEAGAR
jgi:hypothetical protein